MLLGTNNDDRVPNRTSRCSRVDPLHLPGNRVNLHGEWPSVSCRGITTLEVSAWIRLNRNAHQQIDDGTQ